MTGRAKPIIAAISAYALSDSRVVAPCAAILGWPPKRVFGLPDQAVRANSTAEEMPGLKLPSRKDGVITVGERSVSAHKMPAVNQESENAGR